MLSLTEQMKKPDQIKAQIDLVKCILLFVKILAPIFKRGKNYIYLFSKEFFRKLLFVQRTADQSDTILL